jgi:hypothetical protein
MNATLVRAAVYTVPFLLFFMLAPFAQLDFLARVPGDIGDARLNAYFLEHIWQVLIGRAESFVHLPFFAPNPWIGSFSDNHWGTAGIYIAARAVGLDSVASFQLWWLFAYVANYLAALIAFRMLKFSVPASTVAALFFAFALPVTAHTYGHAQLSYRFGAVLALAFYINFLLYGGAKRFVWALFFTVWQTYATIYIGFFTLISLLFVTLAHCRFLVVPRARIGELAEPVLSSIRKLRNAQKAMFAGAVLILFAFFVLTFIPYLIPADTYGSTRSRGEIWTMLPRVASYAYTLSSAIWQPGGWLFDRIPMRHEHQMFVGIGALTLILFGALRARNHAFPEIARMLWVTLAGLVLVTLNSDGVSLWIIFSDLPLASAIRAMTRIDLVMLFFGAGLIAVAVDQALKSGKVAKGLLGIALLIVAAESTMLRTRTMTAASIRETAAVDLASVGEDVAPDALLFLSQTNNSDVIAQQPWFAMEVRAMWAGLHAGFPVINGYSGNVPPGARPDFGIQCQEAGARLRAAYVMWPELTKIHGPLESMIERVHLIGFPEDCTLAEVRAAALSNVRLAPLPPEIAQGIILRTLRQDADSLIVELSNTSTTDLIIRSTGVDTVNIAWRWPDLPDGSGDGFLRATIYEDIPAGQSRQIRLPITEAERQANGRAQISVVQEGQFWFHDRGMALIDVPPL